MTRLEALAALLDLADPEDCWRAHRLTQEGAEDRGWLKAELAHRWAVRRVAEELGEVGRG